MNVEPRMAQERHITCADNADLESTKLTWYGKDVAFIEQVETGGKVKMTVMLEPVAAAQVRDALNEFLSPPATYPNGAPMFAPDGMMLDEKGERSIFDDVDQ